MIRLRKARQRKGRDTKHVDVDVKVDPANAVKQTSGAGRTRIDHLPYTSVRNSWAESQTSNDDLDSLTKSPMQVIVAVGGEPHAAKIDHMDSGIDEAMRPIGVSMQERSPQRI